MRLLTMCFAAMLVAGLLGACSRGGRAAPKGATTSPPVYTAPSQPAPAPMPANTGHGGGGSAGSTCGGGA